MSEINLVPKNIIGEQQKVKNTKNLNLFGFLSALMTLVLAAVLFFLQTNLKNESGKVNQELETMTAKLADYKVVEGSLSSLDQKYQVYRLYKEDAAGGYSKVWSKIKEALAADGGSINKLEIKEDKTISLVYETRDFPAAAKFLKDLGGIGYSNFSIKSVVKQAATNNILVSIGLSLVSAKDQT